MIESLIAAERECISQVDINPDKVLRPIGTTFREWTDCLTSTELPHWMVWEVIGYIEAHKGRSGNTLFYERFEEIQLKEKDNVAV